MTTRLAGILSAALVAATLSTGAIAAPVAGSLSNVQSTDIVQVRRGGDVAAGAAVGLIGGLAIGSAIANDRRGYDYYDAPPAYYAAPPPRPRYVRGYRPVWDRYQGCYVDRRGYCVD